VSYSLFILPRAKKQLARLPTEQFNAAELKIHALQEQPRPAGCKKLVERAGWRIRVGDYRILYKSTTPIER
jgi:mRNA interferase RelE/StbE